MTNTDTDPLDERLWDAIFQSRDAEDKVEQAPTESIVRAVLPIIAGEVRKAKAEALREAAPLMHDFHDAAWLETQATEYETGTSDDLRR